MQPKYYSLGKISIDCLPNDNYSYGKIMEWVEKVGKLAFTFKFDYKMVPNIRKIVELSCGDWCITQTDIYINKPNQAMVMSGILEAKDYVSIVISIQKGIKIITFHIAPSSDSWTFITTEFYYRVPSRSSMDHLRAYTGEEFGNWSAFFCDMEFDDSLGSLVKDLCDWYDKQDVIAYNELHIS